MVKIATITHQPVQSLTRSPNAQHPFSRARQFQRAFNATKLQKLFAKPLVGVFTGHSDGISVLSKCPLLLNKMISGAHDGQIRVWDLAERKTLISLWQHRETVKGVSFSKQGERFLSSSADKSINLYDFRAMFQEIDQEHIAGDFKLGKHQKQHQPLSKYLSRTVLGNVEHSTGAQEFATSGQVVQVWSYQRSKPIYQLQWNVDSILKVRYSPSDPNILCGTCSDRSILIYDLRGQTAVQKVTLPNKSACISFNPLEPMNFTVGNDDSNCYSFDLRRMDRAKLIHKGHISAVTDIDFASSGRQFVSGSFDRTLRLFDYDQGHSKEVYHAKRMQIVNAVQYTLDSHYLISASEDMNLRMWKSLAWRPSGQVNAREQRAVDYREKLVEKYKHSNKIRRIATHRHIPKYILNANQRKQDQSASRLQKKINREANTGEIEGQRGKKKNLVENIQIQEEMFPGRKNPRSNKNQDEDNE